MSPGPRTIILWLALAALAGAALASSSEPPVPVPALDEEGYVLTTLRGTEVERIPVRFVGVLRHGLGPNLDLWLVELQGPAAEEAGVVSGMSGSPVFFGDRMVGALSYRFGLMPKRAIGGVTPIDAMRNASIASAGALDPVGDVSPIATPVVVGGALAPVREWLSQELGKIVPSAVAVGGVAGESGASGLQPGSPMAIEMVRGDMRIAATGTVTWVEGETVYALGHPFLTDGRVDLPLSAAEVVHTLSDLAGSTKITNIGAEVGAVHDDRLTAVVGRLGAKAPMFPVEVEVGGPSFGRQRLRYEVASHPTLTPILVGAAVANALFSNTGYEREATITATGRIRFAGLPDLPIRLAVTTRGGADPSARFAGDIQRLLAGLYANPFREPAVESVSLNLHADPERRWYRVERLLYDRGPVRPGQEIVLTCVLGTFRGESERRALTVRIPDDVSPGARLAVAVGSPGTVEIALGRPADARLANAANLESWIRVLSERQAPDRLTAVLFRGDAGVVANGEQYTELPPTAKRLLSSGVPSSRRPASLTTTLDRTDARLDGPVEGGLIARFVVEGGDR